VTTIVGSFGELGHERGGLPRVGPRRHRRGGDG
jgi:hypothetical protein